MDTFDPAGQRPTAVRLSVTLCTLVLAAATVLAALTGHPTLTMLGMVAVAGISLAGHADLSRAHRRQLQAAVAAARTDPLTGLPNRALADETIAAASRAKAPITVALIDVNGLHTINGNLGHAAGDQYLTVVARRLTAAVPPHGVLVRQGGDEFTLLAWHTDPDDLAAAIGAAMAGPAVIGGARIQPRVSVGIAASSGDGAVDARLACSRADAALATAKRDGGNLTRVFDPDRDPEPSPDGTRPLLRRHDTNPVIDTGLAWQPVAGDELIPVLLSPQDLRIAVQALTIGHDRWAAAAADTAGCPHVAEVAETVPDPGLICGRDFARFAATVQARYADLLHRLQAISETADAAETPAPSRQG